ncbi:guanine nucleotide exchange factor for Rab-3A isoform X2 [Prionailurus bengalensis]|uniref:guanine nucleotide exchange factor for Rab-3A isoform X2 n=1 Tax=Prionailurus bengalensis TaxID=37029 RepID=UPI001CA9C384|nr:guanine nucleotide exchange factor for Rab-3A isoform X2 [Prionailurus bengalensis]
MWSGQPHPDEGHPPPLEAVPVPWKSVGPCKSHRTESPRGLAETPGGEEAQGEEGPAAAPLDVLRLRSSSMEIREKGSEFLKEELHKAQKELKLKDEECERLSRVREQLERELEELTASLFEEAHKMVRAANMKQAASEKQLKEARGKIDMLQAEVTALKTLVLTSTPASPNRELHPQLLSPTKAGPRKGHLRHKSTSSTLCPAVCPAAGHTLTPDKEGKEVDTTLFAEFQAWRESPTLDKSCPFLERVYREDVGPCLDFTMQEVRQGRGRPTRGPAPQPEVSPSLLHLLPRFVAALGAGTGRRGGQHAHHRARGFADAAHREGGRGGVWQHQYLCPERAGSCLSPPNPAWGLRESLLHLTVLPGQDHRSVQLPHLHPLHPARPGAAGSGADVLGDHEAAEGDVAGQARLLSPGGLGHGRSLEGGSEPQPTPAPAQTDRKTGSWRQP